ncbi:hypothetical protein DVH24_005161 [Malus domestica]|uniref:RRM domain-containing protein n=1 Tax=Malus domestica TaxID=3750 RepID=A0A498IGW8_MALDO|nr:hypothetical protein DVH24_005161 [Malus domestica]
MSHFGRSGPPDITDTYSLLVLNITFRTSADDLFPLFDKYGKVVDIFIPRDPRYGNSTLMITYEAQKAVERLDGRLVDGREITVQFAKYGPNAKRIHKGRISEALPKSRYRSRSHSPRRRYQDDYRYRDYRRRSRSRSWDRSRSASPDYYRDRGRGRYDDERRSPTPYRSQSQSPYRSRSRSPYRSIDSASPARCSPSPRKSPSPLSRSRSASSDRRSLDGQSPTSRSSVKGVLAAVVVVTGSLPVADDAACDLDGHVIPYEPEWINDIIYTTEEGDGNFTTVIM